MHLDPLLTGQERRPHCLKDRANQVDYNFNLGLDLVLLFAWHFLENFLEDLRVIYSRIFGLQALFFEILDDLRHDRVI